MACGSVPSGVQGAPFLGGGGLAPTGPRQGAEACAEGTGWHAPRARPYFTIRGMMGLAKGKVPFFVWEMFPGAVPKLIFDLLRYYHLVAALCLIGCLEFNTTRPLLPPDPFGSLSTHGHPENCSISLE